MKTFKKVLIIISIISTIVLILGLLLVSKAKKEDGVKVGNQDFETTNQRETESIDKDEEITIAIEEQEPKTEEQLENSEETIESEIPNETSIKNDNIVNSNDTNKITKAKNNTTQNVNQSKPVEPNNQNTPNNTQQKTPIPQYQQTKPIEENKPVEVKKEEPKPVVTTPVRTYKENTIYISKLRNTITTTVRDNLTSLNKYGITSAEQYKIKEDPSICAYNGGNRNGWTYENPTAYDTFVKSILKGTSLKIYAVDEYYNGEYIQTLCYYGH